MSSAALPPNPCLVAIILVIQAHSGPRLVFHYPHTLLSKSRSERAKTQQQDYDSSSSDEESSTTSDDDAFVVIHGARTGKPHGGYAADEEGVNPSASRTDDQRHGETRVPWGRFLGLDASELETLLMPTSAWHKRKFEVGLNELVFVGWPVFMREDGTWRKKKSRGGTNSQKTKNKRSGSQAEIVPGSSSDACDTTEYPRPSEVPFHEEGEVETGDQEDTRGMNAFNIVFVLNPPILEYNLRIKEMYDNVIKKFGKALKLEQARASYVSKQSDIIVKEKAHARDTRTPIATLYNTLREKSTLANAIASVYESISQSLIASVTLTPAAVFSLQIPPLPSTAVLPSINDPPSARTQPGVWLTTATAQNSAEIIPLGPTHPPLSLAKNFTLLLLDDVSKILADISQSGGRLTPFLTQYIRVASPTKSFAKLSAAHSISLSDIQVLAEHLVYWRRARAIPPLHQRDVYIVSPNADLRKLPSAAKAYESAFPTLPSLFKMLQALSGTPRPYSSLIPSKEHKATYFMILSWLLRGGWVTQLRSFGFVKVGQNVKVAVKEQTRTEKLEKNQPELIRNGSIVDENIPSVNGPTPHHASQRPNMPLRRASSDIKSSTSSQTSTHLSSLILQPSRASPTESKWLSYISTHLSDLLSADLSPSEITDLQHRWPSFTKYFNGSQALEKIPVREGIKRKVAWDMLADLGLFAKIERLWDRDRDRDRGREGKGEEGTGGRGMGRVLIGVRHW